MVKYLGDDIKIDDFVFKVNPGPFKLVFLKSPKHYTTDDEQHTNVCLNLM